jgi:hypothetical protein
VSPTAFLHPPHRTRRGVETISGPTRQYDGVRPLDQVKRRRRVQLARSGRPTDGNGRTPKWPIDTPNDGDAGGAGGVRRVTDRDPERAEIGAHAPLDGAFSGVGAATREQSAHFSTPRMLHMLQTKRPQSEQG